MKNAKNHTSVADTGWHNLAEFEADKCSGHCPKSLLYTIHTYLAAAILAQQYLACWIVKNYFSITVWEEDYHLVYM